MSVRKGAELYRRRHGQTEQETETAEQAGTAAAGGQLYRARRRGLVILPGGNEGTDVTPGGEAA